MRSVRHDAGGVGAASMFNPALDIIVVGSVVVGGAGVNPFECPWHLVDVRLVLVGMFVNAFKIEDINSVWNLDLIVSRLKGKKTTAAHNKHLSRSHESDPTVSQTCE